jgi:hypothetical protein
MATFAALNYPKLGGGCLKEFYDECPKETDGKSK